MVPAGDSAGRWHTSWQKREQRSFSGRDPELLEQRREELLAAGLSADLEAFDTSDPEKILAGMKSIAGRHGCLDGLINNTAIQHRQAIQYTNSKVLTN